MRVSAFLVSAARAFYGSRDIQINKLQFNSVNDDIEEFKSILENLDGDHADVLTEKVDKDSIIDNLSYCFQADNLYDKLVSAQNAVDFETLFSNSKALAFKEIINKSLYVTKIRIYRG